MTHNVYLLTDCNCPISLPFTYLVAVTFKVTWWISGLKLLCSDHVPPCLSQLKCMYVFVHFISYYMQMLSLFQTW